MYPKGYNTNIHTNIHTDSLMIPILECKTLNEFRNDKFKKILNG